MVRTSLKGDSALGLAVHDSAFGCVVDAALGLFLVRNGYIFRPLVLLLMQPLAFLRDT